MSPWEAAKMALAQGSAFGAEFVRLARAGELDRRFFWYGVEGAKAYVEMIAAGDIAPDFVIDVRRAECAACPSRTYDEAQRAGYCGPKLKDRLGATLPTCGCAIDAKTACGSEECPQGKWASVTVTAPPRESDGRS